MKTLPNLRQLQYFLAVMETASFSKAAALCSVTQPTLSAGISDLETMMGVRLFERTSRSVVPTRAGYDIYQAATGIVAQAADLMDRARTRQQPLCGPLRLGVIPTIAPYVLPQVLPSLQAAYPRLELEMKEDQTGRLLTMLEERHIDAVLMAFPFETPQAEQMILWDEPFYFARSAKGQKDNKAIAINDIPKDHILLLDDGHCLRDHVISACRLGGSSGIRKTFGATSLQTLLQFVQNGYGATMVPGMAIDYVSQLLPGVIFQPFRPPCPSRQIGLAWRKGQPRAPEFRLLGEFIAKTAGPR